MSVKHRTWTLKIAINTGVVDKPDKDDRGAFESLTADFENVDVNAHQLAGLINEGFAFCAQHEGRRKNSNFLAAGFVAVDVDHGLRVEEAVQDDFVKDYASLLYTTPSHSQDHHRFRIVFELEEPITDAPVMRDAYKGVIKKFGGDPVCKDACRFFFGSKGSNPVVFGNVLPGEELDKIIALGSDHKAKSDYVGTSEKAATRSSIPLDLDQLVKGGDGNLHRLGDINENMPIYCPFHIDTHPSAHTVFSRRNRTIGIHCSACDATYWPANHSGGFDFDYSLRVLSKLEEDENRKQALEAEGPDDLLLFEREKSIHRLNERFLPDLPLTAGVTLVKSPKGTGKTRWLEKVVADCKKLRKTVLLIGHRQSLIQATAIRLGLVSYLYWTQRDDGTVRMGNAPVERHYAICADSMSKLLVPAKHKYDVVIIDEVEQVFQHLTAKTLKERRRECFLKLIHYLNVAQSVIALDADLHRLTVETIADAREETETPFHFYINEFNTSRDALALYEDRQHLLDELVAAVQRGEKTFVCMNSKKKVKQMETFIEAEFGASVRMKAITSENAGREEIQDFIRNITSEIREVDLVIASPSLGTGIDISFPGEEKVIDNVFGFFEARVNTHFDIDQQLSRVRHPKRIRVWASPEVFYFETEPDAIRAEAVARNTVTESLLGFDKDGNPITSDDKYLNVYANVTAKTRASKNALRANFRALREFNGWTVEVVARDKDQAESGLEIIKEAKRLESEERKRAIVAVRKITFEEYDQLRHDYDRGAGLTEEQGYSMRRYELETFYCQDISEELVELDDDGRYRERIKAMERYLEDYDDLKRRDLVERRNIATDKSHHLLWQELMFALLQSAGLADEDHPVRLNTVVSKDRLGDFVRYCRDQRRRVEDLLGIDIRRDLSSKPTSQLSRVLHLIGLGLVRVRKRKVEDGQSVNEYIVHRDSYTAINAIIDRRKREKEKRAVTDTRSDAPRVFKEVS